MIHLTVTRYETDQEETLDPISNDGWERHACHLLEEDPSIKKIEAFCDRTCRQAGRVRRKANGQPMMITFGRRHNERNKPIAQAG